MSLWGNITVLFHDETSGQPTEASGQWLSNVYVKKHGGKLFLFTNEHAQKLKKLTHDFQNSRSFGSLSVLII